MKLHNSLILLKALLQGHQLETSDGVVLCMSDQNEFGTKITTTEGEELVMIQDWSLNWFIKFAEKLSDEKITQLAASLALNKSLNPSTP